MLKVTDLSFSYGKKKVLGGVSFSAGPGTCVWLAGENGAGKSTLLTLLSGALKPDSGSIQRPETVGYAPQTPALFSDMTVLDNLKFFARLRKASLPQQLPLGVGPLSKLRADRLSGGMQKRVSIVCALLGQPELLLLDEPWEFLDADYARELTHLLFEQKQRGAIIVCSGHRREDSLSVADVVLQLKTPVAAI